MLALHPSTGDQLNDQNDERNHEQQMNEAAENVKPDETKQPKHKQNNEDCPEHRDFSN
jgi:hypothetical protein